MYYVYVISSLKRNYTYIGITDNLERRLKQHQSGYNRTTNAYRPFKLIFSEEFIDRLQARSKEKYLKTTYGRIKIRKMLSD